MENLGNGYTLIKGDFEGRCTNNYGQSYLYKDGVRVNDLIFRRGGLSSGWKDGYCVLILYTRLSNGDFSSGIHVIINEKGQVILESQSFLSYTNHIGGIIGSISGSPGGTVYYNLVTGKVICKGNTTMSSREYIFIDASYDHEREEGVYKVNFKTGEVEVFRTNEKTFEERNREREERELELRRKREKRLREEAEQKRLRKILRDTGRNATCLCGSGLKFKKCCQLKIA